MVLSFIPMIITCFIKSSDSNSSLGWTQNQHSFTEIIIAKQQIDNNNMTWENKISIGDSHIQIHGKQLKLEPEFRILMKACLSH